MSWTVLLRALFALSMTSHLRAYCNSGLKHFAVCVVVHSSIVNGRFPAVRLEMVENLKSHSTAHVMSWTVLLRALFALSMTSHLRAYCNSGLKHFAVCVVVHSSIVNGRFPAVRLEMVENLKC